MARTVLVWLIVLTSGWSWMVQGQSKCIMIIINCNKLQNYVIVKRIILSM